MKKIPQWLVAVFISVAFGVLFGIGVVASSLIFQPEKLTQDPFGFWLSVGLKTLTQLVSFNLAYFIYIVAQKNGESNLQKAFRPYARFVSFVYAKCLQQKVRDQIKTVNRQRFIETADTILENITESLHYADLFIKKDGDEKPQPVNVRELVNKKAAAYELTRRQRSILRKSIVNIINGRKVKYEKVDYNTIMIGAEKVKNGYATMATSEGGMLLAKNATMVVSAAVLAIITSIFILGAINGDIIYEILSSLFTIIVSVLSAIVYGVMVVTKLIRAYSARRDFFNDFIELPPEEPTKKEPS